jgi:hypothetical protein
MQAPHVLALLRLYHTLNSSVEPAEDQSVDATHAMDYAATPK